ncbi:helix-turn-helix domain-containing protein [Pararhodonellum marinum]|uniref:helix-turn-helix domain-containing protein n=1 Tax=Pararhodonellum marinum TaxID=2755358 RepID=UPI00188EC32B|nr:AraC family transcriptional regulator [Pararhodonellum marinum]
MEINLFLFGLSIGASLIGILCAILLLVFKGENRFNNALLAVGLWGLSYVILTNSFTYTNILIDNPHFFRSNFPFHYLTPAVLFLYVRGMLYGESSFRKWDFLHFIPAVLHSMEMLPFYFKGAEYKRELILFLMESPGLMAAHGQGFLPDFLHPKLKCVVGLVYTFCALYLIFKEKRKLPVLNMPIPYAIYWLLGLMTQLLIFYVVLLSVFIFQPVMPNMREIVDLPVVFLLLSVAISLLFNPSILYNKVFQDPKEDSKTEENIDNAKKFQLNDRELLQGKCKVEDYLTFNEPFLQASFSISQLSEALDLPVHHLSQIINRGFGMSYSDLINQYRVEYMVSHYHQKNWEHLTLEGIAREVGFGSRSAFIQAFKKIKGMTPSAYFNGSRSKILNK